MRPLPLLIALVAPAASSLFAASAPRPAEAIVGQFCVTCHGPVLSGSVGPNIVDSWAHYGQDRASDIRNIRDGWPKSGMPAFGEVLTTEEIGAVADYLTQQRREYAAGRIKHPTPPAQLDVTSELHAFRVETWVGELGTPWGIAFLPDGRLLVTEREGRLRVIKDGELDPHPVAGTPEVLFKQDGGMLDVAVHPRFAENGWIYLSFSERGAAENTSMTRIVRGRIVDHRWTAQENIFVGRPELYFGGTSHYGCRLAFDTEGFLYFGLGDRGRPQAAQDITSPLGKIHRVRDDGRVPADNPFAGRPGACETIWTYGHRHNQGFAWTDGRLWVTEHGPTGGDELNALRKGANYGWPITSFGTDSGRTYPLPPDDTVPPATFWSPSLAPAGLCAYTGTEFPKWRGQLLVGALGGEQLRRLEVRDGKVLHDEVLFRGMGRVRHVTMGPDGKLYLALNNPGRIARISPLATPAK